MSRLCLAIFCLYWVAGAQACTGLHGVPSIPVPGGGGLPTGGGSKGKGSHGKKCLHADSPIQMADRKSFKLARDIVVGDRVWDGKEPASVILAPVTEMEEVQEFIEFRTEKGHGATLTPEHAVFARPCGQIAQKSWPIKRSGDLSVGECVPTADGGEDKVVSMAGMHLVGRVQPITSSGRISTGGVLVSCYDSEKANTTQEESHATFEPARLMYGLAEKFYNAMSNEQFALGILDSLIKGMGLEKLYYQ